MSRAEWQTLLDEAAQRYGVPGAVLAISEKDNVEVLSTGVLNVDTQEAVRPDSMFQIGSISKVLTASTVMALVDEGKVELDAPVRQYLPGLRTSDVDATKTITMRQLLSHTSGLDGDFMTDTGDGPEKLARYVDRCALLPHLFAPGEDFSYSNSGYTIAGRIVEIATGLEFEAAIKKYILDPLKLKHSAADIKELPGRSVSAGHTASPEDPAVSVRVPTLYTLPLSGSPAGSTTMMSAEDLIAFARMHLAAGRNEDTDSVLSAESVAAMQEVEVRVPVPARGIDAWGLGWFFQDVDGVGLIGHDGGTIGQNSYLRIDKRTETIGVLYANGGAANDFFLEVFGSTFDPLVGCETPAAKPVVDEMPENIERFAGTYRNVVGDTIIDVKDGALTRCSFMRLDDTLIQYPVATMQYLGDNDFGSWLPNQKFPTSTSFRKFSADGQPMSLFSGLRWYHRVQ